MNSSRRFDFIDQLRAIAVILVLINHISERFVFYTSPVKFHGQWLDYWSHEFYFGRMGVTVFFIISGFVIPSSFSGPTGEGAARFLISRFFRLFPLFWFSILVCLPTQQWSAGKYNSISEIILNATMLPEIFNAPMISSVYWTLAVELLFYGLCLILFLSGVIRNQIVLSVLCLIGGAAFIDLEYYHNIPFIEGRVGENLMFLGFMFWGALCRIRYDEGKLGRFGEFAFWTFAVGWTIVFPMAGFHEAHIRFHVEPDYIPRYYGTYFAAIVIFLAFYSVIRITSPIVTYIGKISYSIYLLQGVFIYGISYIIDNHMKDLSGHLSLYISLPLVAALTIVFSGFTYRWIEKPSQNMAKRVITQLGLHRKP